MESNFHGSVPPRIIAHTRIIHVQQERAVSTSSASTRVKVLQFFQVFNFRGSRQPRIIPIQRKFPELR